MVRRWERQLAAQSAVIDVRARPNRFAAVYESDQGGRGLVVATYPSMREATEDTTNLGSRIVATARHLMTGEWIAMDAGGSVPPPKWPARA